MTEVKILLGPPGTGKTTALLSYVEDCLQSGIAPQRIAFMSHTRKAANEAITRACERFGFKEDQFPWFRTLHSTAFRVLKLNPYEVMRTPDFMALGKALKWADFKSQYSGEMERPPNGGGKGDQCMKLYYLARATGKTYAELCRHFDFENVSLWEVETFASNLEQYKKECNKYDYTDFLDLCHDPIDVDVFIVDEAQDLTNQQWAFARRMAATAKKKLLAGDDDQAIFEWAGASPETLQRIRGEQIVLPVSYRLPRAVFRKADSIARRIKRRIPKTWEPRDADGKVISLFAPDQADLKSGGWLLLARNQYQLEDLIRVATEQGVVYQHGGEWSNQAEYIQAVVTYEGLRAGKTFGAGKVREMMRYIRGAKTPPAGQSYTWEQLKWPFEGKPDWLTALNKLTFEQKTYIRGLLRRGESLSKPGRVVISTIHGAKGGEADNVLLMTGMSGRNWRGLEQNADQENRVWYVGASRAKENLFYVPSGKGKNYTL